MVKTGSEKASRRRVRKFRMDTKIARLHGSVFTSE
jgi:hypothetical protein